MPDVFIVPSKVIAKYFARGPEGWPRARYHESIENLRPYKNDWKTIRKRLTEHGTAAWRTKEGQRAGAQRKAKSNEEDQTT